MLLQSGTIHFDTVPFSLSAEGDILFDRESFRLIMHLLVAEKLERDSKVKFSVLKNVMKYIPHTEHPWIIDKIATVNGFGPIDFADMPLIAEEEQSNYADNWHIGGIKCYKHASDVEQK